MFYPWSQIVEYRVLPPNSDNYPDSLSSLLYGWFGLVLNNLMKSNVIFPDVYGFVFNRIGRLVNVTL